MRKIICIITLLSLLKTINPQYISKPKQTCENSNKAALVEHFFNVVFAEFQSTPPVCVCVQMCIGQSTYCYPNGCLKREERVKKALTEVAYNNGNQKPFMVMTEQKTDFMDDLLNKNYADESKMAKAERQVSNELLPDPFKDEQKYVFQYKKLPKVQIRYNLREQVRNTKSDVLKLESTDMLKSRWPVRKMNKIKDNKIYPNIHKPIAFNNNNFFTNLSPENGANDNSKYSKRDTNEINLKAIYLTENNLKEDQSETFSLEALIDNLIEDTLVEKVNTEYQDMNISCNKTNSHDNDLKENTNNEIFLNTTHTLPQEEVTEKNYDQYEINTKSLVFNTEIVTNHPDITVIDSPLNTFNGVEEDNIEKRTIKEINETNTLVNETKISSVNNKNITENVPKTIKDDKEIHTNAVADMITSLSKKIQKQNNTSLEMMRRHGYVEMNTDSEFPNNNEHEDNDINTPKDVITMTHDNTSYGNYLSDVNNVNTVTNVINTTIVDEVTTEKVRNGNNIRTKKYGQRIKRIRNIKDRNFNY